MSQIVTLSNATLMTNFVLKVIISLHLFTKPHLPPTQKHRLSESTANTVVQPRTLSEIKDIKHTIYKAYNI